MDTCTSSVKENKIQMECVYNPNGGEYKHIITTVLKLLVSSKEFENMYCNGTISNVYNNK